jgi:hypothetical protein
LFFEILSRSFGIAPEGTMLTGLMLGNNIVSFVGLLAPADSFFVWVRFDDIRFRRLWSFCAAR